MLVPWRVYIYIWTTMGKVSWFYQTENEVPWNPWKQIAPSDPSRLRFGAAIGGSLNFVAGVSRSAMNWFWCEIYMDETKSPMLTK